MTIKYNLVSLGDQENLTAFINGEMYVASQDHPNWERLVAGVRAQDENVASLFDPQAAINEKFERLTDRVSVRGGKVYFDSEVTDSVLAEQIIRFYNDDEDFMPLVNFMEKVATNPETHSREMLYGWLRSKGEFTITPDGDVLAYKGVNAKHDDDFDYESTHSGHAIVDGVEFNGHIPQRIGSVVEMPRGEVQFNPGAGCSTGLHVGTHSYASDYGNRLIRVVVNPRDVVSVPTDSGEQKMRVCRYVVIEEDSAKIETPVYKFYSDVQDEDLDSSGEYYCEHCGPDEGHDTWDCPYTEDEEEDDDEDY